MCIEQSILSYINIWEFFLHTGFLRDYIIYIHWRMKFVLIYHWQAQQQWSAIENRANQLFITLNDKIIV